MADTPLLIAGLGNPGAKYARNRHNAGFIVGRRGSRRIWLRPLARQIRGLDCEGALGGAQDAICSSPRPT